MKLLFLFIFLPSLLHAETFEQWKKNYAKRASKHGIPVSFSLMSLADVKPDPEVIKKDRSQVTSSTEKDYQVFIKRWLRENPSRIEMAKEELQKNLKLLSRVEKKYGVDKEAIIALWGTETYFGRIAGDYDLVRSLATLAYDGRRRNFFEIQLNAALRLLKQGHITREKLKGSWAGATGNCQFMPSNHKVYAQDFDGDGKKDIWTNKADIFASIAYYLKKVGWQKGKSIGSLVLNSKDYKITGQEFLGLKGYKRLGFKELDGSELKRGKWSKRKVSSIPLKNSPAVLRGSNYTPLMRWNGSSLFAAFNILLMEGMKR